MKHPTLIKTAQRNRPDGSTIWIAWFLDNPEQATGDTQADAIDKLLDFVPRDQLHKYLMPQHDPDLAGEFLCDE